MNFAYFRETASNLTLWLFEQATLLIDHHTIMAKIIIYYSACGPADNNGKAFHTATIRM